jgi:hypothetical protein
MDGGVGDIWTTGAFSFESPLKDLLDSENYTVQDLLKQDELLQELRGMHPTLLEFFSQEDAVLQLVQHVVQKPAVDEEEEEVKQKEGEEEAVVTENGEAKEASEEEEDWDVQQNVPPSPNYSETDVKVLRFPYVACEVLCSEINAIVDTVVDGNIPSPAMKQHVVDGDDDDDDEQPADAAPTSMSMVLAQAPHDDMILDLFFSLLYTTEKGQLDDYRAGYFDKILAVLCRKRSQALTLYINEGGGKGRLVLMKAMLKHLYSHSILQVVQRLLLPSPDPNDWNDDDDDDDDEEDAQQVFRSKWFESPEAIDYLFESLMILETNVSDLRLAESQNASEVLITMIQNSPLTSSILLRLTSDPLLGQIATAATAGVDYTPHDNSLTCAMNVLESIVLQLGGYGSVSTEEESAAQNGLPIATPACLLQHLPSVLFQLRGLLRHESTKTWTSMMQFSKEPQAILGTSRLRIIRLVESLVLLGNSNVDAVLCESEILQVCLDLFWEFEWNSMLHQSVANLLVHVFEGANARAALQQYFVQDCNLLERLVESFEEEQEAPSSPPPPTDDEEEEEAASNDGVEAEDNEKLPISDDDVDAALERQDQKMKEEGDAPEGDAGVVVIDDDERDPRDHSLATASKQQSARSLDMSVLKDMLQTSSADAPSHIPSLRKGYMGHVIIVCQALVHACTVPQVGVGEENQEYNESLNNEDIDGAGDDSDDNDDEGVGDDAVGMSSDVEPPRHTMQRSEDSEDTIGETQPMLVITSLIASHPMQLKWEDFVTTTLASETAIQSTPLGGFHAAAATIDPLHSHRPGPDRSDFHDDYDDDEDDDDLPGGGDVIDMDDNDIEIAASMMDALNMPKSRDFNSDFGDASGGNEYMFDDPLGGGTRFDANFDSDVADEDDEDSEAATRRVSSDLDPPVMDLFAGNIAFDSDKEAEGSPTSGSNGAAPPSNWSADFANFDTNFDDAFSAPEAMPEAVDVISVDPAAEPQTKEPDDIFASDDTKNVDDIFGAPGHHDLLLDAAEAEAEPEVEEILMVSHYPSSRGRADSEDSSVDEEEEPPSLDDEEGQPAAEEVAASS